MILFSDRIGAFARQWVTGVAIVLLFVGAGAASASQIGQPFDISLNNFGVAGGGNSTATSVTFGTPTNVDDFLVTSTSTTLGNGNELLEITLTSVNPFTTLSDGGGNWDIFVQNFAGAGNVVSHYWSLSANGTAVGMQNGAPGQAPYVEGLSPVDGTTEVLFNPNVIGGAPIYILGGFGFLGLPSNLSLWLDDNANVPLVNSLSMSFEVVPEPGTALLMGLGLLALASRRSVSVD